MGKCDVELLINCKVSLLKVYMWQLFQFNQVPNVTELRVQIDDVGFRFQTFFF